MLLRALLTIVGGGRDAWSVWRRGPRYNMVGPRRVPGVVVRPLNFTVRSQDATVCHCADAEHQRAWRCSPDALPRSISEDS